MAWAAVMTAVLLCWISLLTAVLVAGLTVDFENANDCSRYKSGPIVVGHQDKVYAVAQGRQSNFGGPTACFIRFKAADSSRGLRLFTKHFKISDCGVTLEVYDQNKYMQIPKITLRCSTANNKVYVEPGGEMTLRLAKVSSASYFYNFNIQITTNDSPVMEYPQDVYRPHVQRSTLTEGAMIGISISCIIGGGIIIAAIVFVIVRRRRRQTKRREKPQEANTIGRPLKEQY